MANRWIKIYNINHELINKYNSFKECLADIKISDNTLTRYTKSGKLYKPLGLYFEAEPPHSEFTLTTCFNCGREFQCQRWRIEKRDHVFCSKKCEMEYRKSLTEDNVVCPICGKSFHIRPSHIANSKNNYCSVACHAIAKQQYMSGDNNHQYGLLGELNGTWKSDIRISYYGYVLIRNLNHPFKNTDGFVFEHRLIAEKYLLNSKNSIEINGVLYLSPKYVVHHLDFNRQNNDITNLMIMLRGDHTKMHKELLDETKLLEYCQKYNLNFDEVLNNHKYNLEHYKYTSNNEEE